MDSRCARCGFSETCDEIDRKLTAKLRLQARKYCIGDAPRSALDEQNSRRKGDAAAKKIAHMSTETAEIGHATTMIAEWLLSRAGEPPFDVSHECP